MFVYWISIIIWQTIRPVGNRSLVDTTMKIALFFPLLSYGWKHEKMTRSTVTFSYFLVFLITQMITLIADSGEIGLSQLITIVFMMMEVVIFLIFLFRETCRLSMLEKFCSSLVVTAIVMCLYNMIFEFDTFIYTFSGGGGNYGHECASFLYSNHEFALYLSVSILSLFWLFFRKKISFWKFAFILAIICVTSKLLSCSHSCLKFSHKPFEMLKKANITNILFSVLLHILLIYCSPFRTVILNYIVLLIQYLYYTPIYILFLL